MRCGAVGRLPGLPVARVLLAPLAVLAQGDAIRVVALGLVRHVVATLADLAREGHSDSHVSAGHSALRDCKRTEKRPAVGRSALQSGASQAMGVGEGRVSRSAAFRAREPRSSWPTTRAWDPRDRRP